MLTSLLLFGLRHFTRLLIFTTFSPTTRLNYNTPTFALYLCHPTYDHLRVFGCACYPNFSATESNKSNPRSVRCIFLGYPPNFRGYRCLDPSTGKVHISRHVDFDESTFPFTTTPSPNTYTFLDDDTLPTNTFRFNSTSPTQPSSPPTNTGPTNQPHPSTPHPTTLTVPHQSPGPSTMPSPPSVPSPHTSHTTQPMQHDHPPNPSHPLPQPPNIPHTQPDPPTQNSHHMTTRGKDGILKPNPKYTLTTPMAEPISPIPTSHLKALTDPHWQQAMLTEYKALIDNDTWELVPRPSSHPIIRCMWLFRHKFKQDGSLERSKARLVVNGKSQTVGIDSQDTFSPVVKPATETVYMFQPPGFTDSTKPNHVCRLRKSLYGLKQAPRAWFQRFSNFITSHGFKSSVCDSSLFVFRQGSHTAYLLLYVDDIILTASSGTLLKNIIGLLSREFAMSDLGALHHFLGISVRRDTKGLFFISVSICL
ncbi:putative RNA-directed DNA polymerase [Helianthus annuus]|nr:putative RNA-directed DNA polymerase [Helianthus annuus]KAJ0458792.1 putative RNA-directed DNA polymerase [Helianthus annuus]